MMVPERCSCRIDELRALDFRHFSSPYSGTYCNFAENPLVQMRVTDTLMEQVLFSPLNLFIRCARG